MEILHDIKASLQKPFRDIHIDRYIIEVGASYFDEKLPNLIISTIDADVYRYWHSYDGKIN